ALHRLETCLAEPAQLAHRPEGGLQASARVVNDRCRQQVSDRLSALGTPRTLSANVGLVSPSASQQEAARGDSLDLPAYRTLIGRFAGSSTARNDAAVESARTLGSWALARASAAFAETRELDRLMSAWTPARLRTLDVDRMTMWLDVA